MKKLLIFLIIGLCIFPLVSAEENTSEKNFLQEFSELNFSDYEPNSLMQTLYEMNDVDLFFLFVIIFLAIMAIRIGYLKG